MGAGAGTHLSDNIVVCNTGPNPFLNCREMDSDTHSPLNFHDLIIPNEMPLREVISLVTGIGARVGKAALLVQESILDFPDLLWFRPDFSSLNDKARASKT